MAEQEEQLPPVVDDEEEITPGYKPPAQKTLAEIQSQDTEDESLKKYKETLLGQKTDAVIDESKPNCIVMKLSMVTDGRDDVVLDLSGDLSKLKQQVITIKEGVKYRLKIHFFIQREIVTGLRYHQTSYRKGIKVDSTNMMVGSYGPKPEMYEYLTPMDEAPSGMLYRGSYKVKSKFVDDDKFVYLDWEWAFDIKKDWD